MSEPKDLPITLEERQVLETFLQQRASELYKRRLLNTQAIQGTMERICPREKVKLDKDVVTLMREIVTEFIGVISSEATDRVKIDGRDDLDGDDIIDSLRAFGFGPSYISTLEHGLYLQRHSNMKKPKPNQIIGGKGKNEQDDEDDYDDDDDESQK